MRDPSPSDAAQHDIGLTSTRRIHSSPRQRFARNQGDEVERFSDDEASELDAFGNTILGPLNLVAIHILFIVSSSKSLSRHERSPTGPAHQMGFGNDEGTCIGR